MARTPRKRRIQFGGVPTFRIGGPSPWSDLFYWVMEMSWPAFILLVSTIFILINLMFGIVYAALPGAIANADRGSLVDGFFFSVDTLGTVGYGYMFPVTHAGHTVAAVEILVGLFFSATITGLIFARFARPRTSLLFSNVAVIGRYQGQAALMVRVASIRSRPLADATAQMSWLETVEMPDGRRFRRLTELALVRNRNPILGLAWTLVHMIEDDSPMLAALESDGRFLIAVTVGGTDTLLASQSQAAIRYSREDIRVGHDFVDIMSEDDGAVHLNMNLLHETVPSHEPVVPLLVSAPE